MALIKNECPHDRYPRVPRLLRTLRVPWTDEVLKPFRAILPRIGGKHVLRLVLEYALPEEFCVAHQGPTQNVGLCVSTVDGFNVKRMYWHPLEHTPYIGLYWNVCAACLACPGCAQPMVFEPKTEIDVELFHARYCGNWDGGCPLAYQRLPTTSCLVDRQNHVRDLQVVCPGCIRALRDQDAKRR